MKVSRKQAEANRRRVVEVAGELFRQHGFNGISVADIMKEAGLTQGGFYGNFASKNDLASEVCRVILDDAKRRWNMRVTEAPAPDLALAGLLDAYLTAKHRDAPQRGCPVTSLAADVARTADPEIRQRFTEGVEGLLEELTGMFRDRNGAARKEAIATLAAMVGAVILSRAVDNGALSREFLRETREKLLRG